ncbi:hypothetical protein SPHINGOAX6_50235 [Sphingomonas sp. AX6]|nr:hypothetical protein SPHINGOAX6_50235 [Sphingomonas sp. AX6]
MEALGVRRHQPARHGRREVLDQGQDDHPTLARRIARWVERVRHPDHGVTQILPIGGGGSAQR